MPIPCLRKTTAVHLFIPINIMYSSTCYVVLCIIILLIIVGACCQRSNLKATPSGNNYTCNKKTGKCTQTTTGTLTYPQCKLVPECQYDFPPIYTCQNGVCTLVAPYTPKATSLSICQASCVPPAPPTPPPPAPTGVVTPVKAPTDIVYPACQAREMPNAVSDCVCPKSSPPNYDGLFSKYDGNVLDIKIYNNYSKTIYALMGYTQPHTDILMVIQKFTIPSKGLYIISKDINYPSMRILFALTKITGWDDQQSGKQATLGEDDGMALVEMDGTAGGWDYDISYVNYASIPLYMVSRTSEGSRVNVDYCDGPMVYSGAGVKCTNVAMMKGCPTAIKTVNGMQLCPSSGKYCQFGQNSSSDLCQGKIGGISDVVTKGFKTPNVTFDQAFVDTLMGATNKETPVSAFYNVTIPSKIDSSNQSVVDAMSTDNHPFIYDTIMSGIHRGKCSIDEINNSACQATTAISCDKNGVKGNLFPLIPNYRTSYQKVHPNLSEDQLSIDSLGGCSDPNKCGPNCTYNYLDDWKDQTNPYNPYTKWAITTHGNGLLYSFPFDDDRGNVNTQSWGVHLDIVLFPNCGTWV